MKTKTKKKEIKKVVQPKKEYGKPVKKEYKEKQSPVKNPEQIVSVSFTRADLYFIQKKVEATNTKLAEYIKTMLDVTEQMTEEIAKARQTIQGVN